MMHHPWNGLIPFWTCWYCWCRQPPVAASSQSSLSSVCVCTFKKNVLSHICLKLSSYLFYWVPLSFSTAGFGEQQFCLRLIYHLHDLINLDHILPQVSPLQIAKSQPFARSQQGRWLILIFFLLPFTFCSFANSFVSFWRWGGLKCPSPPSVGAPELYMEAKLHLLPGIHACPDVPSILAAFFDRHCTPQRTARVSLRAPSRAATASSKFSISQGWCRYGFPLDAVFRVIYLHQTSSEHWLCCVGLFCSSYVLG